MTLPQQRYPKRTGAENLPRKYLGSSRHWKFYETTAIKGLCHTSVSDSPEIYAPLLVPKYLPRLTEISREGERRKLYACD